MERDTDITKPARRSRGTTQPLPTPHPGAGHLVNGPDSPRHCSRPPARKPRRDLLQQPAVAIRITEREERGTKHSRRVPGPSPGLPRVSRSRRDAPPCPRRGTPRHRNQRAQHGPSRCKRRPRYSPPRSPARQGRPRAKDGAGPDRRGELHRPQAPAARKPPPPARPTSGRRPGGSQKSSARPSPATTTTSGFTSTTLLLSWCCHVVLTGVTWPRPASGAPAHAAGCR